MTINIKKNLPLLFEQQAKQRAQHIALVSDQETLTYQQLNERANQLAHYLKHLGTAPETLVALHLGRSTQAIVTILAIFKAGGAYLPLDCNDPIQRLQFILNESQATFLISQSRADLPTGLDESITILILDELDEILKQQPVTNPTASAKMHNLAYVMYTSGSTGKPKGVEIEHRGLPSLMKHQIKQFQLTLDSRVIQFIALTFDISVLEIWSTLLSGAKLYLIPEHLRSSSQGLIDYICKNNISIAQLPPAILVHVPKIESSPLKTLILVGDSCTKETMDFWQQHCRVINSYGPTEATITSTTHIYDGVHHRCIGMPVANTQCYVLNKQKRQLSPGQKGELYISSIGLARGYRKQSELTKQRFILWPNKENSNKPLRLYRTGDRVKIMKNNQLEYIGRIDFQIKFNGIRIEPSEIETAINQHPAVEYSVVVLKKHRNRQYLVAYILTNKSHSLSNEVIRKYLQQKLPASRIPNIFMFPDSLPLLRTGKVNRSMLPEPKFNKTNEVDSLKDETEELLKNLWKNILQIEKDHINSTSNFFNLGGTSLDSTDLISEIKKKIGISIDFSDLFNNPTVKLLAEKIKHIENDIKENIPVTKSNLTKASLSFPQRRIWLAYEKMKKQCPHIYNMNIILNFSGNLKIDSLKKALEELVNRHEIFRTCFPKINIQQVNPVNIHLSENRLEKNLSHRSPQEINKIISDACLYNFGDLSQSPLFHPLLVETSKKKFLLIIVFHHIIIDALSLPILVNELATLYNHYAKHPTSSSTLSQLPVQYIDLAIWQQKKLKQGIYNKSFDYWKNQLDGATSLLNIPIDKPRLKKTTCKGKTHTIYLPKSVTINLQLIAKKHNVTLFTLLLCSIAVLLYRYSHQKDLIIGIAHGERPQPIFNQLIGFFVNMLPIRIKQTDELHFTEMLQQVQTILSQAYQHNAPLEEIINQLDLPSRPNCHPIFQTSVTMNNIPPLNMDFVDLNTTLWKESFLSTGNINSAKFDLSFQMEILADNRLALKIEYSSDLFFSETIKQMAKTWKQLCRSITTEPNDSISSLPLLSNSQKKSLLEKWNKRIISYSDKNTVLQAFNEQVKKRPNAIAIVDGDHTLTYQALNEQANRLAHHILSLKLLSGKENIIAISLERSINFITSALAILKIGSTYLPIDPELGEKRIKFMLSDALVKIIITEIKFKEKLKKNKISKIYIDKIDDLLALEKHNPRKKILPNNLAYVIYTSGSTGEPKGVMIEHHNIVQLVKNPNYIKLGENETIAHTSSINFDSSVFEIWTALLNGHKLVIIPKSILLSPMSFKRIIEKNKITILLLSTALFYRFLMIDANIFISIKWILFGGEELTHTRIVSKFIKKLYKSGKNLINLYGPTETTFCSLAFNLTINKWRKMKIPIGKPIQNTTVYILDSHQQPVPTGVIGEIYIGGSGGARGYLNKNSLTEEKFIKNPFIYDRKKIYCTGDLAMYNKNGDIIFIGRSDCQIKFSGHRIEPGEIEKTLSSLNYIKEAVAVKYINKNNEIIIAYISLKNKPYLNQKYENKIRSELEKVLPKYMIPKMFITLDSLPLNVNGKIDRHKLPLPDLDHSHNYISAKTKIEKQILELWKKSLNFEKDIDITSDFFLSGGNSLSAMELTAMINDKFGEIFYSELFLHPTIASQAKLIRTPKEYRTKKFSSIKYLKKESTLDKDIIANNGLIKKNKEELKSSLLTGATGFLGAFLLDELLQNQDAIIYCLIRGNNQKHASERLLKTIKRYNLRNSINNLDRIKIVVGDIKEPLLGLKENHYKRLSKKIGAIYHSASTVNFIKPYETLKNSNVTGTKNLLRFAINETIKPLHYISSVVTHSFSYYFNHKSLLTEQLPLWDDSFSCSLSRDLGYTQSKVIAEELVWQANSRGVPITIYRPGFILCHSRSGIGNPDQMWSRLIRNCLKLGYFPEFTNLREEFITVDYASKAIIEISKQSNCTGKIFHIVPSVKNNLTTNELFNMIQYKNSPLIKEPFNKWRTRLKNYIAEGYASELKPLLPLFTDIIDNGLSLLEVYQHSPHFSRENTENALRNSQIVELPLEPAIIERYIAWLTGYNR
ncbi:MAG: amino acid adenylation domain-containing protein [Gammaproteobacteria bacterium]|nr:amino acid adenylation domain-containing protein [Gammaproteobacteria bacterium]